MRVLIQRVSEAGVTIGNNKVASIKKGLLLLVGIENEDTEGDCIWLAKKTVGLRVFSDDAGLMNLSVKDIDGDIIIVSQFTLFASTKKGNRPSFIKSAKPSVAIPVYENFISQVETILGKKVQIGEFGAMMDVNLVNDGPVTIMIDSKLKE